LNLLLILLFGISLVVLLAGFLLSSKPGTKVRHLRAVPVTVRPGQRVVVKAVPMRASRVVEPQAIGMRRLPVEAAGAGRAGTSLALSTGVGHHYGRQRADKRVSGVVTIAGLVFIFVLGLYLLNILLPHPALWSLVTFYGNAPGPGATPPGHSGSQYDASQNLVRLSQLDPGQYNSLQEYHLWAYSACSAAAITEVINAYGYHYRVTDILRVEAKLGEITPELGLLEDGGIQRTAAQFGFKTTWGHRLPLDQIVDIANHGRPVIVSFPPDRYAGGHLLVVTGGNSSAVYLADSSLWNRHSLSRAQFLQWWEGFSAVVTPMTG
jgi:hypothetical protein